MNSRQDLHYVHILLLALLAASALLILVPVQPAHATAPKNQGIARNDGKFFAIKDSSQVFSPSQGPSAKATRHTITVSTQNIKSLDKLSIESVIGRDGRVPVSNTTVYPYSAIARVEVTFPFVAGSCTGWLIDTNKVATAAHCLYDDSYGGWATQVLVFPGRNGDLAPFGQYAGSQWYVRNKWIKTSDPKFDYGVIKLNEDAGTVAGFFGYRYNTNNNFYLLRPITVSGYPGDKPYATQWKMDGKIRQVETNRFFYGVDTYNGESGSPVFGKWHNTCNPCVFGIHTYGVGGGWTKNSATRITKRVFNFLQSVGEE